LLAERVAIVFAVRNGIDEHELVSLPELVLAGLDVLDAQALLATAIPGRLDERVRDRLVAESRGNPLAIMELPRTLAATQLPGGSGLRPAHALSARIEESFLRRLEALPALTRMLLLVAAAEPLDDPLPVWRAAERLGIEPSAAAAAETEGLLAIGERVTFLHPIVRSAVYRSSSVQERQAVHAALAEAIDRELDPDRRAWHLAAATTGVDEDVAAELERSAERAQARGGPAAAAAFLQRAVALTRDRQRRTQRALAASQASFQAGAFDAALGLLATAEAGALDAFQRAHVDLARANITFASGLGSDAPALLLNAAKRLEPHDSELARETLLNAWGAAVFAGADDLLEICDAARALAPTAGDPRPLDVLLDGLALLITEGCAAATPTLRRAANALASVPAEDVMRWGWMATAASAATWDFEGQQAIVTRTVQFVRGSGALAQLPVPLAVLGFTTAWSGDFAGASALITEAHTVAEMTGSPMAPFAALKLLVLQGMEAEASALIASTIEQAQAAGQRMPASNAHGAAAVLYNGLGRYDEAARAAQQATSYPFDLYDSMWALPELVEAAARRGDAELARAAFERLAATTQPSGGDFALGMEARCRALLSDGEAADKFHQEAIERLGRTRLRPELARAHLLYGEWLRREQRRVEAREQLRTARELLVAIGMDAFAERARHELIATGATVRRRTVEARDDLTPQERQIAGLARDGLSNPEIGARLFLSPRTVQHHLRKVFLKLGIRSRHELATALPDSERVPA
jgi:DNA-binding CsgD family transcriptional regulator